ncbi:Nucleoredoxin 1-1 like [Heracleum sosnowskyi]|uniref:Nucleoredoxin 1-1 like n=1 Tax=Heracleum sosnowskyi TaxID=360622 RepID=A0AAD8IJ26_9APIA|nr:Nucleoredoxin 1-1 like [Heracleum sosnowskyi]
MVYKHFSHPHNMKIYEVKEGQTIRCSGCQRLCHNSPVVGCWHCNFFLHALCFTAEHYIEKHPSHSQHPLTLIPRPTYCSGSFICNKSGEIGTSFSYCCTLCEIDFHLHCTFLPVTVSHNSHQHDLILYKGSEGEAPDDFCKICNKSLSARHSCYYCNDCRFGAHIYCVINEVELEDGSSDSGTTSSNTEGVAAGDRMLGGASQSDTELLILKCCMISVQKKDSKITPAQRNNSKPA